ncbi:MAG: sigma-70 family RNA polymerase sigma factor [Endomicrobiia bacterium]|nr:sigma-70 family RNA polymerase sigma factor [Endomicrobiia bacterium]
MTESKSPINANSLRAPAPAVSLTPSDGDFLDAFRRGDETAFERLVEEHKDRLYFSALKMLRDKEDAEDVVASAFAAAYKERTKFRGGSSPYTWLWRICFNLCWHHLHKKRVAAFSLDEITAGADEGASKELAGFVSRDRVENDFFRDLETSWIRKSVRRSILSLPKKYRRIVILRDLMDYSYEEMAVILDISRGTVMSRLWRAREHLKNILIKDGIVQAAYPADPLPSPDAAGAKPADEHGAKDDHPKVASVPPKHRAPRFRLPAVGNL